MSLRWNGSFLGSRRDPEAASFSGVWGLRDQAVYQRDTFWTPTFKGRPWFYGDDATLHSSSANTTVTADASAHTKGAWTQLVASTSDQTTFIAILVSNINTGSTNTATLVDIATGASGSETAVVSNIAVGGAANDVVGFFGLYAAFPLKIANATRISARVQSVVGSKATRVRVFCYNAGDADLVGTSADVLGADTSTSRGVALTANNAWTEIASSTSQNYVGFCLVPSLANATASLFQPTFEIGVGASGSEVSFGSILAQSTTSESIAQAGSQLLFFPREVPSGSRIAVRQSANTTQHDATVIAVPKP